MSLKIRARHFEQLRRHGEEAYPAECCGVLTGQFGDAGERTVQQVVPCANASPNQQGRRYRIDPRELVRVQREARQAGLAIVGFYHSHPDRPAIWSPSDLAEAHWMDCSYVITAIEAGKAAGSRSFLLCGGEHSHCFEDEPIKIADPVGQQRASLPRVSSAG